MKHITQHTFLMFSDEESLESDSCSLTSWIVMDLLLMTGLVMQVYPSLAKTVTKLHSSVSTFVPKIKGCQILIRYDLFLDNHFG